MPARKCKRCKKPLTVLPTGRPPVWCSLACRQAAYWIRKRRHVHQRQPATCEWATPPEFFADVDRRFGPFTLDVCATADNACVDRYFTRREDGLKQRWTGRVWFNPPYGRAIGHWLCKARESVQSGDAEIVVCLVFAKTDTAWWHTWAVSSEVEFVRGRLSFGGGYEAPYGSALVVFRRSR